MSELKELLINISEEKNTKVLPENLKVGVEAFGIQGTFTADADATVADIAKDKVAYVNGEKITGTMEAMGDYNAKINVDNYSATQLTANKVIEFMDFSKQDISKFTSFFNMFQNYSSLKRVILPENTSNITNTNQMFYHCASLEEAPYFDTSGVTTMKSMFNTCANLVTVPAYDTSNVTDMTGMFANCDKLSDESLNNILLMCVNATKYTGTKTLKTMNMLTVYVDRIQKLSNYQAFLDAGWTIGF